MIERVEAWDPDPEHFGDDEGLAPWRKGKAADPSTSESLGWSWWTLLAMMGAMVLVAVVVRACL